MAIVRHLERQPLQIDARHREVECTYSIVVSEDGSKYLQIDTYGSQERKMPGKKSQSLRIAPSGILELKQILSSEF